MKLIIFSLLIHFCVLAQSFTVEEFVTELRQRQSRVEEFQYIKKIASKLGIKHVYMFGGTAAAWGHYVRWDMRRELGIEKLQPQRFDYDYTNIFRANQDFDVVIDGTVEQASELEAAVQRHFNYFSGTRPTWEVRLLNEKRADKDSIMGADFQNQHTDSHSTGLIEMMDCIGFDCIKDVRDINNPQSAFLMDLYEAKLHYYFSEYHEETKRFLARMNPPILSVIRYLTKIVQYNLEPRSKDIKLLKKMINNFDPLESSKWDTYVNRWLEKNAKKLIMNAIDMEYAQELIEKMRFKKKLIRLGNSQGIQSMSWWLNKEALKSKPLGKGNGKTAAELFISNEQGEIIVAHETNSFPAYESITKAHNGAANVLISREGVSGESAAYGDGHYTQIGKKGARGTGLTIRYKLNPQAREGSDFIKRGRYIIVQNKNALEVIFESLNLGVKEYFKLLLGGFEFDHSDKGVKEKVQRRIKREVEQLTRKDIEEIEKLALKGRSNIKIIEQWNNLFDKKKLISRELEMALGDNVTIKMIGNEIFIKMQIPNISEKIINGGNRYLLIQGLFRYMKFRSLLLGSSAGLLGSFIHLYRNGMMSDYPFLGLSYIPGVLIWAGIGIMNLSSFKEYRGYNGLSDAVPYLTRQSRKLLRQINLSKEVLKTINLYKSNRFQENHKPDLRRYDLSYNISSDAFKFDINQNVGVDYVEFIFKPSEKTIHSIASYNQEIDEFIHNIKCSKHYRESKTNQGEI